MRLAELHSLNHSSNAYKDVFNSNSAIQYNCWQHLTQRQWTPWNNKSSNKNLTKPNQAKSKRSDRNEANRSERMMMFMTRRKKGIRFKCWFVTGCANRNWISFAKAYNGDGDLTLWCCSPINPNAFQNECEKEKLQRAIISTYYLSKSELKTKLNALLDGDFVFAINAMVYCLYVPIFVSIEKQWH